MPLIPALDTFLAGQVLTAAQLNTNLTTRVRNTINQYGMFVDVPATVVVSHVWNATQNFSPASGVAINIVSGGITVVGPTTIGTLATSGLITAGAGLTVAAGATTLQGVTCTTLATSGTATLHDLVVSTGGISVVGDSTIAGNLTNSGSAFLGTTSLPATATAGFVYIPGNGGPPTGVPATGGPGRFPLWVDNFNNRFYVYNGLAWKFAALS